ncbi:uncharacterized protein LOC130516325 isoform X2 [Takifugu flavidus]|uniref:uncharacterized protein LOC130516325 isoform X2 n=1 Tax=Takifugu flavidus TaxID=433684 RepID=UPI00254419C9|nr:uncharacterized protein LOC130516325 isoform X2 [Takifugu flavidus]XP_056873342.1 uncharacterized protein LOC130516325 isoform X2 [Takifugu flavidus]XP_056873343.1 uncharacterized protein LOC130516325 isoform X2 [Takifugu flavidus]XP_056873345.1 uncharacterized protein LOC130516325 isoform X2 [Takifugu flavidus]XP_056873346.1 uncharacterized protein LOC130516325 isoform X2 [Takifugu flavidus]
MENLVSGTKFFVYVASETKNAHMEWVSKMKSVGHTEVNIQEDADYNLVFCPVKSRIKTDIDEALEGLPDNKALILVVMHHTFDPDLVIVESRLQELPRNVRLTVDSLFYQGRLLRCNRNDIAWNQIQKSLNIPIPEPSWTKAVVDYLVNHKGLMAGIAVVIVSVILVIVYCQFHGWVRSDGRWCLETSKPYSRTKGHSRDTRPQRSCSN